MASYHRVLKVFGRSIQDKTLQCDCDIHPWEILVNKERWSGRIRLIGFVDVFFLISYSGNSRFHDGVIIYKDDQHIAKILSGPEFNGALPQTSSTSSLDPTTPPTLSQEQHKYTFTRTTITYTVSSIGHPISLRTKYLTSELRPYEITLRKHQDELLKRKYKNALKQHDTLDMIQDAMKLGLVSYAEVLGHGLSHVFRGGATLDVGKGLVKGAGASKERKWAGLSGDRG